MGKALQSGSRSHLTKKSVMKKSVFLGHGYPSICLNFINTCIRTTSFAIIIIVRKMKKIKMVSFQSKKFKAILK